MLLMLMGSTITLVVEKVYIILTAQHTQNYNLLRAMPGDGAVVKRFIELAINKSDMTYNGIIESVKNNELIMLAIVGDEVEGIVLVRDSYFYDVHLLEIVGIGGENMSGWLEQGLSKLHELAKSLNIDKIVFSGRDGWLKKLAEFGYEKTHIVMQKVL